MKNNQMVKFLAFTFLNLMTSTSSFGSADLSQDALAAEKFCGNRKVLSFETSVQSPTRDQHLESIIYVLEHSHTGEQIISVAASRENLKEASRLGEIAALIGVGLVMGAFFIPGIYVGALIMPVTALSIASISAFGASKTPIRTLHQLSFSETHEIRKIKNLECASAHDSPISNALSASHALKGE